MREYVAKDRILIVGVGGLGVPALWALARAGARRLTLVDPDPVEVSNLPRQVIYRSSRYRHTEGGGGGAMARRAIPRRQTSSGMRLRSTHPTRRGLIGAHDFVIDATDSPAAKFLINDTCIATRTPFVYGGVVGMTGQAMTVIPGETACIRCVFETAARRRRNPELPRGGNRRSGRGRDWRDAGRRGDARLARADALALRKNSHIRRVRHRPGAYYGGQSAPGMRLRRIETGTLRIASAGQVTESRKR